MYLSKLRLWNFRKYGIKGEYFDSSEAGFSVDFNNGVNVLIGENDSGKTAIIDAIRYTLKTQSGEFMRIEEKDFYKPKNVDYRTNELKIECVFDDISEQDAGLFLEWLGFIPDGDKTKYMLKIWLYAKRVDGQIYQYLRAGVNNEGSYIEGDARDYLKVVYLKPLRDALIDMTHGNKSRFAQILQSHPIFKISNLNKSHDLEVEYNTLKSNIDKYFDINDIKDGKKITEKVNDLLLSNFLNAKDNRKAIISLTGSELSDILRQLDLVLEANKSGLGTLNLLCIAAELLLFEENRKGLKLTLIEELEAHLHPQFQLRLIDFIRQEEKYGQFILTTHSTTLGSKIPLENLIILKENKAYQMGHNFTKLRNSDYKFLERFLDATKANLFFAQGLIIVEGDAENLLIPKIAELIGYPLHKFGISIVNVGSIAFKRYVNIFKQKTGQTFGMPISIISDLDIRCIEYYTDKVKPRVVYVTNEFVDKLTSITSDINYSNLQDFYLSKSEFNDYIDANKLKRIAKRTRVQLLEVFDNELQDITSNTIKDMRVKRKERLENENENNDNEIKIYLPEQWTLEYEIASSGLYKELEQAIRLAKLECNNPDVIITPEIMKKINYDVESDFKGMEHNSELSYEIFKPLNEGKVSKATTAQYLTEILAIRVNEEGEQSTIKQILLTDNFLKYIVNAIYHVTK